MLIRQLLFICCCALVATSLSAQITVSVVPVNGAQIDAISVYPDAQVRIRATRGVQPVALTTRNVFLVEGNIPVQPKSVTGVGSGLYDVRWTISRRFPQTTSDDVNTIFVTDGGITGSATASYNTSTFASVVIVDSASRLLPRHIDLGTVPMGTRLTTKLKIYPYTAPVVGVPPEERRLFINSIETRSGKFTVEWRGSFIDPGPPPPTTILSPITYRFDLHFDPTDAEPVLDTLIVTFEGGLTERVILFANQRGYTRIPSLRLITPNGGEKLAPCQEVDITWTGALKGFPVYVDYSTNGGASWMRIDSSMDSSYAWKVPSTPSQNVIVAVYQTYAAADPVWLPGEAAPATNVAMSADGLHALVSYRNGVIQEWNVITRQKTSRYQSNPSSVIVGLSYVGSSRNVIAAVSRSAGADGIERYTAGVVLPSTTVDLPIGYRVRDIGVDPTGTDVYVTPQFAPQLMVLDATTLAVKPALEYASPVTAAIVSGNELAVMLLDGMLVRYSIPSRAEVDRVQTGLVSANGPLISRVALAPSRRFVAFAGIKAPASFSPRDQMTYVVDLTDRRLIRMFQSQVGTDMANIVFSASDGYLLLGYQANPQFLVYDLAASKRLGSQGVGFTGLMQDMEFGPDGSRLIACSNDQGVGKNTLLQSFATPERDVSDNSLSISEPVIAVETVQLPAQLIGTSYSVTTTVEICNRGVVPWIIDRASLSRGTWLRMIDTVVGDTLLPGACLNVTFTSLPLDTGLLDDTLALYACNVVTYVPFRVQVIDRNLSLIADMSDFGDVCVGSTSKRKLAMLRNNDAVPVTINAMFAQGGLRSQFRVVNFSSNIVLQPGESIEVDVEFSPVRLGLDTGRIIVMYAGSESVSATISLLGRGTGADISASHNALPFIAEIPERDLVLRNGSNNEVQITRADLLGNAPFLVVTTLPLTIPANDSITIRIRYNGGQFSDSGRVVFSFAPCAVQRVVELPEYSGSANVMMPIVTADPRGDATIPLIANIIETVPYRGERFVQGSFTVNPRLFLAREVVVEGGVGEILSQEIANDLRIVRFRITRSFNSDGVIAHVVGWAGIAETDSSMLVFGNDEPYFGSTVTTTLSNGMLRIVHPDAIRRIIDRPLLAILRVTPNPIHDVAKLQIRTTSAVEVTVRVVDMQGRQLMEERQPMLMPGDHDIALPTRTLRPGIYRVVVATSNVTASTTIVVL